MGSREICVGVSQTHRSQVDRDEWGIRNQIPVRPKQRTREIESLLDIGADRSLLEATAHGFGYTHEPVGEERQQDRIGPLWFTHRCGCTSGSVVTGQSARPVTTIGLPR